MFHWFKHTILHNVIMFHITNTILARNMNGTSLHPFVYVFLIFFLFACERTSKQKNEDNLTDQELQKINWTTFTDSNYQFSIDIPKHWNVHYSGKNSQLVAINVYDSAQNESLDLPLTIHSPREMSHISIYPKGWGTEYPGSLKKEWHDHPDSSIAMVQADSNDSYVFMLENGSIWGYLFKPELPPESWSDDAYIFAQVAIIDLQVKCYDENSGNEKRMENCDPLMGDQIVYEGELKNDQQRIIRHSLNSIRFFKDRKDQQHPLIEVMQPQAHAVLDSIAVIKGKARGYWFFEGDFPIELVNEDGKKVLETYISANGEWMTENFVEFEKELLFPDTLKGSFRLILHKDNPSGLPQHADSLIIPIRVEK